MQQKDVQQVFDDYGIQLKQMFDFYARQDPQKSHITHLNEFFDSTLSFKELVRFGYQQRLTPDILLPEEMVRIYKNLMREVVDHHKTGAKDEISKSLAESGVLDFAAF